MATVKNSVQLRGRQAKRALGRVKAGLRADEVAELRARVEELEAEVQENRQLNLRLAELTDVVQELLLPISMRDEEKISELMERYAKGL